MAYQKEHRDWSGRPKGLPKKPPVSNDYANTSMAVAQGMTPEPSAPPQDYGIHLEKNDLLAVIAQVVNSTWQQGEKIKLVLDNPHDATNSTIYIGKGAQTHQFYFEEKTNGKITCQISIAPNTNYATSFIEYTYQNNVQAYVDWAHDSLESHMQALNEKFKLYPPSANTTPTHSSTVQTSTSHTPQPNHPQQIHSQGGRDWSNRPIGLPAHPPQSPSTASSSFFQSANNWQQSVEIPTTVTGLVSLKVILDKNNPSLKYFKLIFNTEQNSTNFCNSCNNLRTKPTNYPNESAVGFGQGSAPYVIAKLLGFKNHEHSAVKYITDLPIADYSVTTTTPENQTSCRIM